MLFRLPNPIPVEVHDPKDLQEYIQQHRLIPYYGFDQGSSHSFLKLLQTVTQLSPTFRAVMSDKKQYCFGLNPVVTARNIPGLGTENPEVEFNLQSEFVSWLGSVGIGIRKISMLSKRIEHHLAQTGNAYLRIWRVRVGNSVQYRMKVEHFTNCIYIESKDPGEEFLLVSPYILRIEKLLEYPPEIVRVTDYGESLRFAADKDGIDQTIVHIKRNTNEDEGERYGRPDIFGCLPWLYVDHQLGNLNSKIAATEMISKIILAFQAPNPDSLPEAISDELDSPGFLEEVTLDGNIGSKRKFKTAFQQNMFQLKELVSNLAEHPTRAQGSPAGSIAGIEYPHGANPPTSIPLEVNRDTEHQDWQSNKASAIISGVLGWSPLLIAFQQANTNLGGNLLYDTFAQKNLTTVVPTQVFHADLWNDLLAQIMATEGAPATLRGLGIEFPDVIGELIDQLNPNGPQANNITAVTDATDPAQNISNGE